MRWSMVDKMKEMNCELKEIKMKHDQWGVGWRKWDETWTMKCVLKEMRWNMNNEIDNVPSPSLSLTTLQAGKNKSICPTQFTCL